MGALNNISVKWLGTGLTLSFTNALTEQNWAYLDDTLLATGDYPGPTGCTLNFLDSTVDLPAANLPNAGEVFALVVCDSGYLDEWSTSLTALLGVGNWGYLSLLIGVGNGVFNSDIVGIDKDSVVGGTVSLYASSMAIDLAYVTVTIGDGGYLDADYGDYTLSQKLTIETGGIIRTQNRTITLNGGLDLAGTMLMQAGVVDVAYAINVTGNCTINWMIDSTPGTITGGLNANGFSVTHTNTTGASLVCNVAAGILDLGTTVANGLIVDIQANQTLGGSFACGKFTLTLGTLTMASKTVTVGAGGVTWVGGALNANGAGTFNLAVSCSISWSDSATSRGPKWVLDTGVTATAASEFVYAYSLAGPVGSTLAVNSRRFVFVEGANNYWTFSGTTTSTSGSIEITGNASTSNAALINIPGVKFVAYAPSNGLTKTLAGGLVCGNLNTFGSSTAGQYGTLIIPAGANLTCGDITLGQAASATRSGKITLAQGSHSIGALATAATNTAPANAFTANAGARVEFSGNINLTGIAADLTTACFVAKAANKTITGGASVTAAGCDIFANGNTLTVTGMAAAPAGSIRCWGGVTDGGGNGTACVFHSGTPDDY